jgi:hypothetical protein
LNEAACGGGRYALARSNSFPFQLSGSSMGRIVIEKRFIGHLTVFSTAVFGYVPFKQFAGFKREFSRPFCGQV